MDYFEHISAGSKVQIIVLYDCIIDFLTSQPIDVRRIFAKSKSISAQHLEMSRKLKHKNRIKFICSAFTDQKMTQ